MSLSDKIEAKRADLLKSRDTLTSIINREESEDGDDIQIDELSAQVKAQEQELERFLKAEEALTMKAGEASPAKSPDPGKQVPRIETKKNRKKGHNAFAAVSSMLCAFSSRRNAADVARERFRDDPELETIIRAAEMPGTTVDSDWAAELVRDTWGEFVELLRDISVYPRVPGMRLEFDRFGRIVLPREQGRGDLAGGFVAEGAPIPVRRSVIDSVDMSPKGVKTISPFTKELANHSTPAMMTVVENKILRDTAELLDTLFLDAVARTTLRPAGMQDATETGAANINASAGATIANIITDTVGVLGRVFTARAGQSGVWLMNPLRVLGLRNAQDSASGAFPFRAEVATGTFQGYPYLMSANVTADIVAFVSEDSMAHGNDYAPMFEVSDQATLVYDDTAPEHIVDAGVATTMPVQSLYQTDSIAVKMTQGLDWRITRQGGVQVLTGVAW